MFFSVGMTPKLTTTVPTTTKRKMAEISAAPPPSKEESVVRNQRGGEASESSLGNHGLRREGARAPRHAHAEGREMPQSERPSV